MSGRFTMGCQIRVVIADDHRLFREGLGRILAHEEDIEIVGEAADELQAIDLINDLKPDVLLLDISMPRMDCIDLIPPIRKESPKTKPLMLTFAKDEAMIFKALRAGAKGYLSRDASLSDLVKAIRAVHRGEMWVERKLIARFFEREAIAEFQGGDQKGGTDKELTPREEEVLHCLAKGWTNKEIGQDLFISEKTVKSHLSKIFRKLNVTRRLQAILHVIQQGLK